MTSSQKVKGIPRLNLATEAAYNAIYGPGTRPSHPASGEDMDASRKIAEAVLNAADEGTVPISAAWLRTEGDDMVVLLEIDGQWIEVIRSYYQDTLISHIVEDGGITSAIEKAKK
jgi:hypothetical protein